MRPALFASATSALAALAALPASAETLYVTADRLIDVVAGEVVADAALIIEDDRITGVGPQASTPAPEGARRIALGDKTILPGLIDLHVHLTSNHDEHGYRRLATPDVRDAISGVMNAEITLLAGFTSARNVGASGYADVALRDAIKDGDVPGPRLWVSGPPIGITGGHCSDNNLLPPQYNATGEGVADGPWAARAKVRQNRKFGVDLIKTCSTGGVLSKGTEVGAPQYTLEELKAIVDEAHSHGLRVASHAHGASGIRNAIEAGVDTVEHVSFIDDQGLAMAVKAGTWLVFDIYNTEFILGEGEAMGILPESLEKERRVGTVQRESFTRAVKAGANVALGTDAGVYPHGQNARQLSRMVTFGMTPMQALQAGTVDAAEALGSTEVGALEVGRYADFIAVEGDPIADMSVLEDVDVVVKGGAFYKGAPE